MVSSFVILEEVTGQANASENTGVPFYYCSPKAATTLSCTVCFGKRIVALCASGNAGLQCHGVI